jgi:hypothetical protein
VPETDLGLVVSDQLLRESKTPTSVGEVGEVVPINGRGVVLDAVSAECGVQASFHASRGYPADLVCRAAEGSPKPRWCLEGLLSEREGRALAEAISSAGASLWVRTRTPDASGRAAAVLLRISTERVRTFSRPAGPPPDVADAKLDF